MQTVAESKLIQEWDYSKNAEAGLDPSILTCGSNKSAWWICKEGHSFQRKISSMFFKGTGCPICSNHLVVKGINDFRSNYPILMLDWDYDKNHSIDPASLSIGSLTRVFWKCHNCGHEWNGKIHDAVEKRINCPKCSRMENGHQKHLACLQSNGCLSDEGLLKDWDYEKNPFLPTDVTRQSSMFVFWKCHICSYEWKAKVANRTKGNGCPCCGRKIAVAGVSDLATTHPDLAREWHPTKNGNLKPTDVLYGSAKRIWWICPNGHSYQASILHRTSKNGTNCPICNSGRQTSFREQAIYYYVKKLYPGTLSRYKPEGFGKFELDVFIPEINFAFEYDGAAWHKKNNFEREERKFQLCKKDNIKLIRIKEKMPEHFEPYLADEILSFDDFESEDGFTQVIHGVLRRIYFRGSYRNCPVDVDLHRDRFEIMRYATEIKHSFAEANPEKAKQWHPTKNGTLKPTMFKPKSNFVAWWLCSDCGAEYEDKINGGGCPFCKDKYLSSRHRMNAVRKNGAISNPLLLKEWDYEKNGEISPELFPRASDRKVWWKCSKCGHEWQSKISNREHGRGCPKCAGYKLFPGYNDLATVRPELLEEWDYSKNVGVDPHLTHFGSQSPVWWKCKRCGYEYQAPVARRSKTGSGCRKCADKANPDLLRAAMMRKHGSLGVVCPDLIPEYSPENTVSVFEIASTSHNKVKWVCSKCGHKWEAAPYSRKTGHGCPICGRKKAALSRRMNKKNNTSSVTS